MGTVDRPRSRRLRSDRAAVLPEFALLVPLLVLMAMGVLEFGFVMSEEQKATTTTQIAARAAANTPGGGGDQPQADYNAISAVVASMPDGVTLNRVVIFDATGGDSEPTDNCKEGTIPGVGYGGVAGVCNIYSGTWVNNTFTPASPSQFTSPAGCAGGVDSSWCPENRSIDLEDPDWVGVYVSFRHDYITGIFGSSLQMSESAVYQLEPEIG